MENYSIVLFIMAIMIGLSALADRIKIPYPILLVAGGIAIGFIPALPHRIKPRNRFPDLFAAFAI